MPRRSTNACSWRCLRSCPEPRGRPYDDGVPEPSLPPPHGTPVPPAPPESLSALPSRVARALAFVSILVGGAAGGLIGYALVDVQCTGDCSTATALGGAAGAIVAAAGTAVVSVLVLRAMGEWRELQERQR